MLLQSAALLPLSLDTHLPIFHALSKDSKHLSVHLNHTSLWMLPNHTEHYALFTFLYTYGHEAALICHSAGLRQDQTANTVTSGW